MSMSERKPIPGSRRILPNAPNLARADPQAVVEISVYLKRPPNAPAQDGSVQSRGAYRRFREAQLKPAMAAVAAFAADFGLIVTKKDAARRLIKLSGSVKALEAAFGTQLHMFDHPSGAFRGRSGSLSAPVSVVDYLEAVLGLDQRPIATCKSVRSSSADPSAGFLPSEVARLYDFPAPADPGKGACVAIVELGGGVSNKDTRAAFKAMGLVAPKVQAITVGDGANQPGKDPDADGEVALDVQVVGGAAPGAVLAVYFATNTDQGFVDAIAQAATDRIRKPSVISISWGSSEAQWTTQAVAAMNSACQDACELGVSIFAASGDGLATDGASDGQAHVDFPASSPWIVGCGGTTMKASGLARISETVWNSQGGGSGGGVSALFPVPTYQSTVDLPPPASGGGPGRGVPDVASDADPQTGYRVVVDGRSQVIGGTSAAAPLWAGLFALINAEIRGSVGQPHARLYAHPEVFNDVVVGDNKADGVGYAAGPGWDACTGLGTPKGGLIAALFKTT